MALDLPAPLAPWAAELASWPLDAALPLAPWLPRLALAVGAIATPAARPDGDPEGYAGLARRGTYERLLVSEWLLAEAVPEEFERRAAAGEHLFLHLARRQPGGRARTVVLLDAGPDQLGAPRLAHLALLVVLAGRARAAGLGFAFGVLQAPEAGLVDGLEAQSLVRWLDRRCLQVVDGSHGAAWSTHPARAPGDELWLVGAAGVGGCGLPEATPVVEIEEACEPRARRLEVTVRRAGRAHGPVTLQLPAAATGARLLRHRFSKEQPTAVAVEELRAAPIRFSTRGHRLLARTASGVVALPTLEQHPAAPVARAASFEVPAGHTLLAADFHDRRLVAVTDSPEGRWVLHAPSGATYALAPPEGEYVAPGPETAVSPLVFDPPNTVRQAWLVDGGGSVFRLDVSANRVERAGFRALAFAPCHRRVHVCGFAEDSRPRAIEWGQLERPRLRAARQLGETTQTAFLGYGRNRALGATLAARDADGSWSLPFTRGTGAERLRPPGRVVGAAAFSFSRGTPEAYLLVVDDDERSLLAWWATESLAIATEAQPIVHVAVSADLPRVAYQLADGTVVVKALPDKELLRVRPGDA